MNSFEMKTKYKFLHFEEVPCLFGDSYYYVKNKRNHILGNVEFYADWDCFAFFPNGGYVLDAQCLSNITDFLIQLNLLNK